MRRHSDTSNLRVQPTPPARASEICHNYDRVRDYSGSWAGFPKSRRCPASVPTACRAETHRIRVACHHPGGLRSGSKTARRSRRRSHELSTRPRRISELLSHKTPAIGAESVDKAVEIVDGRAIASRQTEIKGTGCRNNSPYCPADRTEIVPTPPSLRLSRDSGVFPVRDTMERAGPPARVVSALSGSAIGAVGTAARDSSEPSGTAPAYRPARRGAAADRFSLDCGPAGPASAAAPPPPATRPHPPLPQHPPLGTCRSDRAARPGS